MPTLHVPMPGPASALIAFRFLDQEGRWLVWYDGNESQCAKGDTLNSAVDKLKEDYPVRKKEGEK